MNKRILRHMRNNLIEKEAHQKLLPMSVNPPYPL